MIRLSMARPVAVAMTYTAVGVLGVVSWRSIPIEMLPDRSLPQLTVQGTWRGASPETVEAFLTAPLEAVIQQVPGVDRIVSESYESQGVGRADVQVEFQRDTDMDFARLDLSERIATLEEELPAEVDQVTVRPYVPDEFEEQNRPFLFYDFTGPYTLEALRQHLEDVVAPELAQVDGVAFIDVFGGRDRRLEIELDDEKIAALGLDARSVRAAVADLDLVREAGVVREGDRERAITIVNRPESAEDVRRAVIHSAGGTPVRLGDVADVADTYEEPQRLSRIDGQSSVTLQVLKGIGVNTVRTADAVKARLAELEPLHPLGTEMVLVYDQSDDIERQLTDLSTRAAFAAVVIFFVLLGFLRSLRSTALVFATIAFSVLIALNLVYFGGLTLNLLTLMGLAMGFGLIVDNSIVVLENVYRRWQGGEEAHVAAAEGAREVVLPILASTATTLIVFVPFVYLQGELRVFYVPLAVVVGLTLLASIFVAFTFIPSLSARLLGVGRGRRHATGDRVPFYVGFYSDVVGVTVRHPWVAAAFTAVVFAGSYYFFDRYVNTWAMWGGGGDGRSYISVTVRLPRGSNLERTDQLMRYFEERVAEMPEVERYTSDVQAMFGYMEITFPDSIETTQIPYAIKDRMLAYSHTFTGAEVRVQGYGPSFYGGGGSIPSYGIQVLGYNYETVRDIAEEIGERLRRRSRIVDVDTNASAGRFVRDRASEYVVSVDRERLARHDLSVDDLVAQLQAAAGGDAGLGFMKLGGEDVQYQVKLADARDMDVQALGESLIDTPGGQRIRLGDLVRLEERDVLSRIRREDQQYERTVAYEFRGPARLGDAVLEQVIASTVVPSGYTVKTAEREWFVGDEERTQIWLVLAVSLLLVYMVTAALFESLVQPLCVILTVPTALIGVFLIFFLTAAPFTREAYVGVIMMFGIVVNNAILLVDHINGVRRRAPELPLPDAILRGTLERVRPILMTTTTTVTGLLPLVVLGDPAGSNIWDALALVLIGGLLSSTLFVLTITPAAYGVLEGARAAARARHVYPPEDAGVPRPGRSSFPDPDPVAG